VEDALRVVMPHAKPGIASGCVMVFMLSAGSLLVPTVVGSTSAIWFPQSIYHLVQRRAGLADGGGVLDDLPASLCIVFVIVMMRLFRVKLSDIAK
jgi:spermidine/putrescine transport system permease protein